MATESQNKAYNCTNRPHVVAHGPVGHGIPRDARLHDEEDTGKRQNDGNPNSPRLLRKREDGELSCDDMRLPEIRDRAPLRFQPVTDRIGGDGLPQMVLDFLPHASRERAIETERAGKRVEIVGNHAGFLDGGVPARRLPMASENCRQTARCPASARSPRLVNA